MDLATPLIAREPGRRDSGLADGLWLVAFAGSLAVHAAILLAVTLSPPRLRPEPRVVVPEAISVELVQDAPEPVSRAALANLPIATLTPAPPAEAGEAQPSSPPVAAAADVRIPPEAEPVRMADAMRPVDEAPAPPPADIAAGPERLASSSGQPASVERPPAPAQAATILPETTAGAEPAPPPAAVASAGVPDAPSPQTAMLRAPEGDRSRAAPAETIAPAPDAPAAQTARLAEPDRAQAGEAAARDVEAARTPPPRALDARLPETLTAAAPPAAATRPSEPPAIEARAPETLTGPAPPPASLRPSNPRAVVAGLLQELSCSRITATLDEATGAVALRGNVRSEPDRRRLAATLTALDGVSRVDDTDVRVVGEPYCHVLAFLDRPDFRRSSEQREDLAAAVGAANPPAFRRIAGGQPIELTLSAPDFDSYLYVDHFSADGRVTHLLPSDRPDNFLKADAVFRLGPGAERGRRAVVGPPYGFDVAVVIASSEPLFTRPRPAVEEAAAYLRLLDERIGLLRASGLKVKYEYAYYILATAEPAAASAGSRLVR